MLGMIVIGVLVALFLICVGFWPRSKDEIQPDQSIFPSPAPVLQEEQPVAKATKKVRKKRQVRRKKEK